MQTQQHYYIFFVSVESRRCIARKQFPGGTLKPSVEEHQGSGTSRPLTWWQRADVGMDGDRPLQLREVAEMIRKTDDSQAVVKGLSLLPALIEAAPDELANYSSEPCTASRVDIMCVLFVEQLAAGKRHAKGSCVGGGGGGRSNWK